MAFLSSSAGGEQKILPGLKPGDWLCPNCGKELRRIKAPLMLPLCSSSGSFVALCSEARTASPPNSSVLDAAGGADAEGYVLRAMPSLTLAGTNEVRMTYTFQSMVEFIQILAAKWYFRWIVAQVSYDCKWFSP